MSMEKIEQRLEEHADKLAEHGEQLSDHDKRLNSMELTQRAVLNLVNNLREHVQEVFHRIENMLAGQQFVHGLLIVFSCVGMFLLGLNVYLAWLGLHIAK